MPIHSISFCIPAENILNEVPQKEKMISNCEYDSRIFSDEKEYYREYQCSLFGNTKCKGGWDCMRHYEILANGTIPNFENVDKLPPNTMADFPRDLVKRGMNLTSLNKEEYEPIIKELLEYTRKHLSTESRVKYILNTLGKRVEDVKSVLYLGNLPEADYLRCTVLHGFKTIFKEKCVDVVRIPHIYNNYPTELRKNVYGHGFSFAFRIPAEYDINCDRMNIEERIKNHEFDLIIYGSVHRGLPYLDLVFNHYKQDEIAFLCGEDIHRCEFINSTIGNNYHLFVREL